MQKQNWSGHREEIYFDSAPEAEAAYPKFPARAPLSGEIRAIAAELRRCYASVAALDDRGLYRELFHKLRRASEVVITQVADVLDLWQDECVRILEGKRPRHMKQYVFELARRRAEGAI